MKLLLTLLICFVSARLNQAADSDALRECGNLHHLEFQNLPNSKGEFSNSGCTLKCEVGDRVLSSDAVNEGFACPADANGKCQSGVCHHSTTEVLTEAQRECGNLHHIDFHAHSTGTTFLNSQCALKCVLNGVTVSDNSINEGFACPAENDKICRSGKCIAEHSVPVTPTAPTTTVPHASIFSTMKLTDIRLLLISGNFTVAQSYFQASTCVQPSHDPILEIKACPNAYSTKSIADSTKLPTWRQVIYVTGPFDQNSHIAISVFYTRGGSVGHLPTQVRLGTFVRNLEQLFEQYYLLVPHSINSVDHSLSFTFENKWPVYADSNGQVIGELDLQFAVTLKPK